jgi:hypothetical protein
MLHETVPFLFQQLRIDFLDFTIAQPDDGGNCVDDYLEITGSMFPVHKICGENSDQHGKGVAVRISSLRMNCWVALVPSQNTVLLKINVVCHLERTHISKFSYAFRRG